MTIDEVMRKARYGRRDWVVWNDRNGNMQAQRATREAVKAALLAIGTQGKWFIIGGSTGHMHRYRFSDGCRIMRNAKHIWGRM